jgi:hypothetical protein
MVNKLKSHVLDTCIYRGPEVDTDHFLVQCDIRIPPHQDMLKEREFPIGKKPPIYNSFWSKKVLKECMKAE